MKNKFPTHKFSSLKDMEKHAFEQDLSLNSSKKLDLTQYLREEYYRIRNIEPQRINKKMIFKGKI